MEERGIGDRDGGAGSVHDQWNGGIPTLYPCAATLRLIEMLRIDTGLLMKGCTRALVDAEQELATPRSSELDMLETCVKPLNVSVNAVMGCALACRLAPHCPSSKAGAKTALSGACVHLPCMVHLGAGHGSGFPLKAWTLI